jgi:hypothetical protein
MTSAETIEVDKPDTRSHPAAHLKRETIPVPTPNFPSDTLTERLPCAFAMKYAPRFDQNALTVWTNTYELMGVWIETKHADLSDSVALVLSGGDPKVPDFQKSIKMRRCIADAFTGELGLFDARRNLMDAINSARTLTLSNTDPELIEAAKSAVARCTPERKSAVPTKKLINDLSKFDD